MAEVELNVAEASGMARAAGARERVLLVAPQPFYSDRGTPIAVRHLLEALSQLGYAVDVVTYPMGETPEIPGVRYFRVANPLGLRSVRIGFSLRKVWLDLFVQAEVMRRLRDCPYFCVHAVEEAGFIAVLAARRKRIPVVYDMQSSMAEQMSHRWLLRNRPATALLERCERWLIERADYTVASAGLGERARDRSPRANVREWRYPGPTREVDDAAVDRLRNELSLEPNQPVVLYSGTFESYQGLEELAAAVPLVLKNVPGVVFVLVGADRQPANRWDHEVLDGVPQGALRVLPRQPRDVISTYLAMADVVVSPRTYGSNLPIKVVEYLAAGNAIVATDIPAHRALLDEKLARLASPTPEGLADAITDVLTSPALKAQLRTAARGYAEENLHWLGFVHLVGQVYEEVRNGVRV